MICRYNLQNKNKLFLILSLRLFWPGWNGYCGHNWIFWTVLWCWVGFHSDQMSIHCDHSCQAELWKVLHEFCVLLINCIFAAHQFHLCCLISNVFFLLFIFAAQQLYFWYSPGTNGNRNHSCGRAELWEVLHHAQRWVPHEMEGRWSSLYVFSSSQAWTCSALNISKNMFTKC